MAVRVWTERRVGAWDQCTECAYLMALLYGGFRSFPLGAYTPAERDALDAATPPDPESGGSTFALLDAGASKRYGITLDRITDGSRAILKRTLNRPNMALAIAGSLGGLKAGHRLRRWQPDFTGGHAICVLTEGDGRVRWLDPLAPDGHEGDSATVDQVLAFAWLPSDARVIPQLGLAGRRFRARLIAAQGDVKQLRQLIADLASDATEI